MSLLFRKNPGQSSTRARVSRDVAARLEANPFIKRAPAQGAQIYLFHNYLRDEDCDMLMGLIDSNRRPSTLLSASQDPEFRTSESCDLNRHADEVRPIDEGLAALLGVPPEHGETMQGQRYAPGQQFRAHCDYFHEGESYWPAMQAQGGQRTWTTMIYLNDVEEGGATWFPRAGIRIAPRRGTLLIWNNMLPDGSPNYDTLHEGMKVVSGTKYVITKWFRENPWVQGSFTSYYGNVRMT
ncbi:prolyl hydroxylase family protein [Sphingomonas canadensis]|uniref:Prolyl hydroxylase family protein n=1 Tax=Sphingomonas canadensis TaxID=1219257 RepID=A0ABW3HA70_9SPHN|nr:2OG-Fe(II) oxygenase [Sphingomonas canadensis]MCW3837880.1 2OG-Fe(II) oxygenase [Sphingomonas canadensis]